MRVITMPESLPPLSPKRFYLHLWDDQSFTISAQSYYRTEQTYVFTNLPYPELKKHWMQGTLMEIPPLLEVDTDSVIMIIDQEYYEATTPAPTKPKRRTTRKKTVDNKRKTK